VDAAQVGLLDQADLELEGGKERDQHGGRHQVGDQQGQAGGGGGGGGEDRVADQPERPGGDQGGAGGGVDVGAPGGP
jgi:hypothetical protein